MRDYSSYPPEEAESLRQLDKMIQGIVVKATIITEIEKLWRREGPVSQEEVEKVYKEMEEQIDEILQTE